MTQFEILNQTINKNGAAYQTSVAMEELAELIQAISKCKRYGCRAEQRDNLIEEIADVKIIIMELMLIYGISASDVTDWQTQKMKRLEMGLKK